MLQSSWTSYSLLSPIGFLLLGDCDDLSVACRTMIEACAILLKLLRIVMLISSLRLNICKTQVWVICRAIQIKTQATFQSLSPDLVNNSFKDYMKYLGIPLGPDGRSHQYEDTIHGYHDSYKASFVAPSRALLTVQRGAQHRPMRGPVQAYHPRPLHRLKLLSREVKCTSIEWWSLLPAVVTCFVCSKAY